MIGKQGNNCVVCILTFFEGIEHHPEAMIRKGHRCEVGLHRMLPLPGLRYPFMGRGNMIQIRQFNRILA